jgi:hypothetical protein
MKHTKGPWQILETEKSFIIETSNEFNSELAVIDKRSNPENARLIAAAPELLESIIQFVARLEESGETVPQHVRYAIAKATGSES